jgi:hypothetical protein
MRKMILFAGLLLLSATGPRAQDSPAAEVSAGYSCLRLGVSNSINENGGSISIAGNVNRWFGLVADAGGYHASPFGVGFNPLTCMGGPHFSCRIGFYFFDRFFRNMARRHRAFNWAGYHAALDRYGLEESDLRSLQDCNKSGFQKTSAK